MYRILDQSALADLPDTARVWIYAADRPLSQEQVAIARRKLAAFAAQWQAHGRSLRAAADLLDGRFLILAVDERQAPASGCSIDASVAAVHALGAQLGVDFFNRMIFFTLESEGSEDGFMLKSYDRNSFARAYQAGTLTNETPVLDPLVKTLGDLRDWPRPLGSSWHARMV